MTELYGPLKQQSTDTMDKKNVGDAAHLYTTGQSWRDPDKDAVYAEFSEHPNRKASLFVAEFDNYQDASFAAIALNAARPFEYSLLAHLTKNNPGAATGSVSSEQ